MIYTVVFNSTNNQSVATAGNRGSITYGIDWTFLPQGKKYKVSFTFNSRQGTFTSNNALSLYADFTGSPLVYQAGATIQKNTSNFLGLLFPVMVSANTDTHFVATSLDNSSTMIHDRPNNNLVTIRILDHTGAIYNLAVDYILSITFEEVVGGGIGVLPN